MPASYFDRLIASLAEPDDAPGLARATGSARRREQITAG